MSPRPKKRILGIGLDGKDRVVRITRGKNFHLVGGSQDTHESMQEKCIKFNERLSARGRELEDLAPAEFQDLARECRMNVAEGPEA